MKIGYLVNFRYGLDDDDEWTFFAEKQYDSVPRYYPSRRIAYYELEDE